MRTSLRVIVIVLISLLGSVPWSAAQNDAESTDQSDIGRTPPRLSYMEGQVSFWRPGAEDWVQAQINTALAPGDQLFVSGAGNLELQVGAQAFVRAGNDTLIALETHEPDFLRFKVSSGMACIDLRTLAPGRAVEVITPHGAFTIDHAGYYRLNVDAQRTTFITRRTGRATVIPPDGQSMPMEPNEAVVLEADSTGNTAFQAAPALDDWDGWNYDRTDQLLGARSLRYVSPETYGATDLDRYGSWRTLPSYGSVWVPSGVASDWAPYTTGNWMYDPYYGWTWVDTAPWGWAPYHYGRWVHTNNYWCWAPGPVIQRPVYAPALVAFFNRPGLSVGVSIGGPTFGWVALGWGEPVVPWWGRSGFIHRPYWGGWGGPRIVNGHVVHHRTVVRVEDIRSYHNCGVPKALIAMDRSRFGHGPIDHRHLHRVDPKHWRPSHDLHHARPSAASYAPSAHRGHKPPEKVSRRSFVQIPQHHDTRPTIGRDRDQRSRHEGAPRTTVNNRPESDPRSRESLRKGTVTHPRSDGTDRGVNRPEPKRYQPDSDPRGRQSPRIESGPSNRERNRDAGRSVTPSGRDHRSISAPSDRGTPKGYQPKSDTKGRQSPRMESSPSKPDRNRDEGQKVAPSRGDHRSTSSESRGQRNMEQSRPDPSRRFSSAPAADSGHRREPRSVAVPRQSVPAQEHQSVRSRGSEPSRSSSRENVFKGQEARPTPQFDSRRRNEVPQERVQTQDGKGNDNGSRTRYQENRGAPSESHSRGGGFNRTMEDRRNR